MAAVAGAASFYADFAQPVPHRRVCRGTSCFVARGGEDEHGGDTDSGKAYCLGYCYAAPAELVGTTARTGQGHGPAPSIPYSCAAPRAVALAGLLDGEPAWSTWPMVVGAREPAAVLADIATSGLRGRGGAGFPVAAKWRAALAGAGPRWVVANGDEGDPGSYCDRLLMENDPHRVLEGLAVCGYTIAANRGLVLVRSEYPAALAAMRGAVEAARSAGHLGVNIHRSGFDFDIEVRGGAGSYVAGEETALLRSLAGLRGSVQARPPYPAECGYAGRPTVVQNVETLAAVPWIVRNSGEAYARWGLPAEPGTKLVCLSEGFAEPGVYEVEFGTSLRWIVSELGGGMRSGRRLRAIQIGGPLGGFLAERDLDVPLAASDLESLGVHLGHAGLVAIDDRVTLPALLRHLWTFADAESCGSCAPCRIGSRRGLEWALDLGRTGNTDVDPKPLLDIMEKASLCAFGSGIATSVRSLLRAYEGESAWTAS